MSSIIRRKLIFSLKLNDESHLIYLYTQSNLTHFTKQILNEIFLNNHIEQIRRHESITLNLPHALNAIPENTFATLLPSTLPYNPLITSPLVRTYIYAQHSIDVPRFYHCSLTRRPRIYIATCLLAGELALPRCARAAQIASLTDARARGTQDAYIRIQLRPAYNPDCVFRGRYAIRLLELCVGRARRLGWRREWKF